MKGMASFRLVLSPHLNYNLWGLILHPLFTCPTSIVLPHMQDERIPPPLVIAGFCVII